jgi:hypothetical protein
LPETSFINCDTKLLILNSNVLYAAEDMSKIKTSIYIVYRNNNVSTDADFMADRKMGDSEAYCYASSNKTW